MKAPTIFDLRDRRSAPAGPTTIAAHAFPTPPADNEADEPPVAAEPKLSAEASL